MDHPPTGTNHISPPYSQTYPPVQQPYGREQDFSSYPQKMGDPYYSSQRSGTTAPIYPTPLPALIEPGQNFPPRGLDGPKIGGQQFALTSPGYGQGSAEMGPMMRALTEDDVYMPQPPEYRSPMQTVGTPYGQPMGYASPDGTRAGFSAGQYPSPFSPGHSPRASQIYPVRSHPVSPHDSGFGANPSQYHRQTSQSPHMNMVSPTGQNSVFNRGTGVTAPSPVGLQGQSMYSHSPGSSQGGRSNTHFPFSTSPSTQHTSPLPSPSSLRSPGVVHSPHNLATASPGPFNTPSNPSPVNVPRPIKSPVAAFQTPAAVTQSGHPLVSPKVRPVDNGDHSSGGTQYVELLHTRNNTQNKTHSTNNQKSPESPYPKKKEDRCSSGHLPKLEEMVAFLGESATKGILTPNDKETAEENGEKVSKDTARVDSSSETSSKSHAEQEPPSNVIHSGSVQSAERQPDISSAKQRIVVQENSQCAQGNENPKAPNRSQTDRVSMDGSPKGPKTNGEVSERSPLPKQLAKSPRSPRRSNGNKDSPYDSQNGPISDTVPHQISINSSLDSDPRRTQSPETFKVANDISQVDKNSMSVNNQLKRKFSETQNDVYHNSFNNYPRNGGQSVTAYPLTYTPPNSNNGKDLNQYRPNSPRGSKSPARKSKDDFSDGSPRKVLKTYSGKKKRTSVDKQGNAIVLPSPLLPLSMTDPPKPKEDKQTSSEESSSTSVVKEDQEANPKISTAETTVPPRSTTPTFNNPMTTPSSQRSTPEKPTTTVSQKVPPCTPSGPAISDASSTPTPTKRRGRPPGSKNKPRKEGDPPKQRKKPTKKNFDMSLEVKDELGKFKHLKSSVKSRSSDSPVPPQARSRGPVLRITGTRDNPVSCKIVNNPDTLATGATAPAKKRGSKHDTSSSKNSHSVSRAPLGPATKQSLTVNNPTGSWLCALCGKPANYDSLGDLYGPYYPPGYQIPILSPQSTHEKTKSAVAAAASKKQQQYVRTNQKGKLKTTISPSPATARTSKVQRGKASRTTSAQRQRKYSNEAEYFMLLEEATTSSGRVSKTPKRMTFEMSRVAGNRAGNRRRKSSELEDRGPSDPNEYWVHEDCVIWTQGVYVVGGTLYGLAESIKATQSVACFECKDTGASLGCMSKGCKKTYHYVCALKAECQLQVDNYSMICPQHKDKVVKMKDLT
ncbi:retinoic acid-induced protein 1-like [Acanthaster planci]|uniref:Retinoic acid-induced protein 1-like n=1 Tax=Acanthaster planci TaxID=133434 RepID=A0A8B7ZJH8_ACAPL|nr:retinoic acid-induced protein 1-like [Acanthaster planci]XP_022103452.1 retinoic acid-induced protein 1-like [Acanthaster planci]